MAHGEAHVLSDLEELMEHREHMTTVQRLAASVSRGTGCGLEASSARMESEGGW